MERATECPPASLREALRAWAIDLSPGWSVAEPWVSTKDGPVLKERRNLSDAEGIEIRSRASRLRRYSSVAAGLTSSALSERRFIIIRIPRVPLRSTLGCLLRLWRGRPQPHLEKPFQSPAKALQYRTNLSNYITIILDSSRFAYRFRGPARPASSGQKLSNPP